MYIRESRRIQAKRTELEQHVGTDARMQATGKNKDELTASRLSTAQTKPIRRFGFPIRFSNQISDFGKSSETAVSALDFQRKAWKSSGPN